MKRAAIALALLSSVPAAWAYSVEDVLSRLEKKESETQAVRFDFTQDVDFTANGMKSRVAGKALFAKAGKFKINKTSPDEQVTVSNGEKIWIYTPAYNQVYEGKVKNWVQNSVLPQGLVPLQNYSRDLRKNFSLTLASSADGPVHLLAEPKNEALGYRLEIFISTTTWLPVKTLYVSESAKVATTFANLEENPPLTKNAFQFSKPAGTDVIPLN